jgi:hypothetical protein
MSHKFINFTSAKVMTPNFALGGGGEDMCFYLIVATSLGTYPQAIK